MKKFLKVTGILAGLAILAVIVLIALTPWMDRWGATDEEISATYPGDELVPEPASFVNRAVTINAPAESIYPWIVQLDAKKGGWYSYTWLEGLIGCRMTNADRIHAEWQNLQVGDEVHMCPGEPAPPPYSVAQIHPNQAIVMGHQENGEWVDLYQFVIVPQTDGTSRLILRTRTMMVGGFWTILHPGTFIMERGMLLGIKQRAEAMEMTAVSPATPTPEVFNPLDPSPTASSSSLPLTCQVTDLNVYIDSDAGYCFAYPKRFTYGTQPMFNLPAVMGPAVGSTDPVSATFAVEIMAYDPDQGLDQQVEEFLRGFTVADPKSMTRAHLVVGGEPAVMVDVVPVQLSWRLVFVPHDGQMYRLMYWPVDVPEAQADVEELYQTTIGSFAFLSAP